jgi:hypothetical protein
MTISSPCKVRCGRCGKSHPKPLLTSPPLVRVWSGSEDVPTLGFQGEEIEGRNNHRLRHATPLPPACKSTADRGKTDCLVEFLRGRIDVAAPSNFGAPLWNAPAHDAPRHSTCRCSRPSAPPSVTAPSDAARRMRITDIASACGCAAPGYSRRETECRGSLKPVAERGETERAPKFSQDQIKHSVRAMWPGPLDIYSPRLGNRHGHTLSTLTQEKTLPCVSRARARRSFELFLSLFMACRLAYRFPARRPRLRGRPGSDSPARLDPCDLIDGNRTGTSPVNFAPKKLSAGVTADVANVTVYKNRGSTSVSLAGAQISTPPRTV